MCTAGIDPWMLAMLSACLYLWDIAWGVEKPSLGGVAGEGGTCGTELLAPLQDLPQYQVSQCVHQCSPSVCGSLLHRVAGHHSAWDSLLHRVAGHRRACVSIPHALLIRDHPVRGSCWPVVSWSRGTISSRSPSPSGPPLKGFLPCRKVTNSPSG